MSQRAWCITDYHHEWDGKDLPVWVRYVVWQLEECPKTGKQHWQMYAELNRPQRMSAVKGWLGARVHCEKRKGTREQARAYCMKEETRIEGPWELGRWIGGVGHRSDLEELYLQCKDGMKDIDILKENTHNYMKNYKAVGKVKELLRKVESKKFRKVTTTVLWGDAGTGKTRQVVEKEDDLYKLDLDDKTVWFDGYDGESALLIDDYYGYGLSTDWMLRLLDGYQLRLPVKGGFTYANWTRVYITSNKPPEEWWGELYSEALKRRITKVLHVTR